MKGISPAVSLLLTNLRLLNYPSDDSFPITPDVFTSLTNKGKAFEYIAHHLYSAYAPEECEQRLRACWPVYEPAQSRELRNAVFKWLEDLKKSGRLAGVLIRRTTLDDCCGQRYEELLLALSTMVLRERIESGYFGNVQHTFAYRQATSAAPSQQSLTVLNLAHRYTLRNFLDRKKLRKSKWKSFTCLLDLKEAEVNGISEKLLEEDPDAETKISRVHEESVRSKWRNNWLGDTRWLDIMLNGDPESTRDFFLELPFDTALAEHHRFMDGRALPRHGGVSLKELDKKVAEQQRRVEQMRQLREKIGISFVDLEHNLSPKKVQSPRPPEKKGLKVEFRRHQNLHYKYIPTAPRRPPEDNNEYTELLDSLQEEMILAGGGNKEGRTHEHPLQHRELPSPAFSRYRQPEITFSSPGPDTEICNISIPFSAPTSNPESEYDYNPQSPTKISQTVEQSAPTSASSVGASEDEAETPDTPSTSSSQLPSSNAQSPILQHAFNPRKAPIRQSMGFGEAELLAEQIVSTIAASSFSPEKPSPIKKPAYIPHKLSPIDSPPTRFSLPTATTPSFSLQDDTLQPPFNTTSTFDFTSLSPQPPTSTPLPPQRTTTPKEEILMSGDYNSVFKSRPKIALSPPMSPISRVGHIDDSMDLDSASDDSDEGMEFISSPLVRKNRPTGRASGVW